MNEFNTGTGASQLRAETELQADVGAAAAGASVLIAQIIIVVNEIGRD